MTPKGEEWRPVVGFEGLYEVSSFGRVRSLDRLVPNGASRRLKRLTGRMMRQHKVPPTNYLSVQMSKENFRERRRVHVMVLESFVGPRPAPEFDACHNNGDPLDNSVGNLRWDTKVANAQDSLRAGTNRNASKTSCKRGHAFTPANTYILPKRGARVCRTCVRLSRGVKQPRI
ncbi:NUMOD4 domain-containing protein [Mycolicibacterium bacteremicum]|uniref:HNH nuclease domain-containing protein n=1 Tax=Mycolicibacterium bacteremicum TaxID=564198 RepID=A0A1W9Z0K5_MYCBA|nr:HNH endonuclease [Mycolicibacterium bacteremicum]ORA05787.1 hypothetical protein BST17_08480 [Mycolicibacterium bacteremicum]